MPDKPEQPAEYVPYLDIDGQISWGLPVSTVSDTNLAGQQAFCSLLFPKEVNPVGDNDRLPATVLLNKSAISERSSMSQAEQDPVEEQRSYRPPCDCLEKLTQTLVCEVREVCKSVDQEHRNRHRHRHRVLGSPNNKEKLSGSSNRLPRSDSSTSWRPFFCCSND